MSKFKIGDWVRFSSEMCVSINLAQDEWPRPFRVDGFNEYGQPTFENSYWWCDGNWGYDEDDFELADPPVNTKDMYEVIGGDFFCGNTRFNFSPTYQDKIIIYGDDGDYTYIHKKDIPSIVAALLDIYDGTWKEEPPF